jgi:hypothetical protein
MIGKKSINMPHRFNGCRKNDLQKERDIDQRKKFVSVLFLDGRHDRFIVVVVG